MVNFNMVTIGDELLMSINENNSDRYPELKDGESVTVLGKEIEDDEGYWPMLDVQTASGRFLHLGPGWFREPNL